MFSFLTPQVMCNIYMPLGPSIKISCFSNMVLELRFFFSGTATRPPDRVLPLDLPIQSCSRCCPSPLMVDAAPSCYSMPQSTSTCCVCAPLLICTCMITLASSRPTRSTPRSGPLWIKSTPRSKLQLQERLHASAGQGQERLHTSASFFFF